MSNKAELHPGLLQLRINGNWTLGFHGKAGRQTLQICLREFPEICKKKHGMAFDLASIERTVKPLRGRVELIYRDFARPFEGTPDGESLDSFIKVNWGLPVKDTYDIAFHDRRMFEVVFLEMVTAVLLTGF